MKLMKTLMIAGALVVSTQAAQASDVNKDVNGRLTTIVKYDDLDLNRAASAETLHNRLWVASKKVCVLSSAVRLKTMKGYENCREQALSDAVAEINNPNLNEKYLAHKGKQGSVASVASLR
jgi:UrcA family protein